jgi:hypothetical protein
MDGARIDQSAASDQPPTAQVDTDLLVPPDDLSDDAREFWTAYAPRAIDERTLVPATAYGFRVLCQQAAEHRRLMAVMNTGTGLSKKAGAARRDWLKLSPRLEVSLKNFKLTAWGKPADGSRGRRETPQNPWAKFAR